MTYDDGIQHICRLMGTYQSLQEGQTKIMSNFCNGFGYSWNIFYSPLTALLPLIFKFIGASFTPIDNTKVLFIGQPAPCPSGSSNMLYSPRNTSGRNILQKAQII